MTQKIFTSFSLCLLTVLVACSLPQLPLDSTTAVPGTPDSTIAPEPSQLVLTHMNQTAEMTVMSLTAPITPNTGGTQVPCNRAAAGRPLDVTIPDGTVLTPGESFIKTWRLTNLGSCDWDQTYSVVFFSGDDLSLTGKAVISQVVSNRESVDISVEMIAPLTPGMYQTNWKLQSPEGELFGLGPAGDAPIWARIEVIAVETPTIEPSVTATSTPPPYASGEIELLVGESVDLDSGVIAGGSAADLVFNMPASDQYVLVPQNGARVAVYSFAAPTTDDCLSITISDAAVTLEASLDGAYLCYLTNQGLPGSLHLSTSALPKFVFQFQTWSLP